MTIDPKIYFIIPLQLVLLLAYFPIARRLKLYDVPNERSSHTNLAFRGGGIIIPFSLIIYSIFFWESTDFWLVSGVLIASAVSFYDDFTGTNVFVRLMCHFVAIGMILMELKDVIQIHEPLLIILLTIACVAAVNAYNFMDGINAITGLYTLSVYETIIYYSLLENTSTEIFNPNLLLVLTSALLIFGFYNFRTKAILFAGDVGSVSLGLISIFYVLKLIFYEGDIIYLSILSVYGVEAGLTILYRLYKRQNILQAHRMHLFQDLVNKVGLSHLTTSFLYTLLQVIINTGMFIALYYNYTGYYYFAYVIIFLTGLYIILKYQIHQHYLVKNEED